jgi:hypothetical protein
MSTQVMQKTIADYFKTQPVLKAWLFGSFARGEETPRSDVDILFVPDYSGKPFTLFTHGGMLMDLQELLGREVDLVVEGTLRPYAAETANRDKILIYERKSEEDIVKAARSMKADGMAVEKIEKYTGLTAEEIEGL